MISGLVVGAVFGLGVVMAGAAILPRPTPLGVALDRLYEQRGVALPVAETAASAPSRWSRTISKLTHTSLVRNALAPVSSDIRVTGRTPTDLVADIAIRVLVGGAFAPALSLAAWLFFDARVAAGWPIGGSLVLAVTGAATAVAELRAKAKRRRSEFLQATAAYMEFVRLGFAFRGVEGALWAAARSGSGWAFEAIAAALDDAHRYGEDAWQGLGRLGDEFDITELTELGGTLSHAKLDGALSAQALAAKARSLRVRALADEMAKANAGTEQMQVPVALLGLGMFLLLLYPAVTVMTQT